MHICTITDSPKSYASQKLAEEAHANNIKLTFAPWKTLSFTKDAILLKKKVPLKNFDAVILRSSKSSLTPTILIVEYCKHNNIRLLNEKFYLRYQTVNKLRQQFIFQLNKIPCLKTSYSEDTSFSFLKKELGLPFIAKFANRSLGRQVFKITSKEEFEQFIKRQKGSKQLCLFQKFYPAGIDYRVFIVGERAFGPVRRLAPKGEWKTNMHGSSHQRAEEEKRVVELAKLFLEKTDIEFAGLDILVDSSGKARLIEINTMACFSVFDEVFPEINIAKKTIELLKRSY